MTLEIVPFFPGGGGVPFDRTMTAAVDDETKHLAHWLELELAP
jgi:hypothetical protein